MSSQVRRLVAAPNKTNEYEQHAQRAAREQHDAEDHAIYAGDRADESFAKTIAMTSLSRDVGPCRYPV